MTIAETDATVSHFFEAWEKRHGFPFAPALPEKEDVDELTLCPSCDFEGRVPIDPPVTHCEWCGVGLFAA